MTSSIFITGTSTGIGKTITSSLILSAAHHNKRQVNYFKPIQTGRKSDCCLVKEISGVSDKYIHQPIYSFKLPASPYQAALTEQCFINPNMLLNYWQNICDQPNIIEGAGGLLVPINKDFLMRDLIKLLNLRLIIVASTTLGTINHTLLTIEAALSKNITILGIILFGDSNRSLIETLNVFTHIPILATIPHLKILHQQYTNSISHTFFNKNIIRNFFD